jgi:NitT/TauT family transport system ATP-binding protein
VALARMQDLVVEAARQAHFGALFITHDLTEAADRRIAVIDTEGRGVAGWRALPGQPGERTDHDLFETVQGFSRF